MKNINIKDKLTPEEAMKFKNFNGVLNKFYAMKIPFYKSPYFLGGGVLTAVVTSIVLYNSQANFSTENPNNLAYEMIYESPIEEELNAESHKVILSDKEIQLTTNNGTRIVLPPNILVDSNGNEVVGEIEIRFREVLNQKDIFMSGMPMNYNENGEEYVFESGGMFEVLAYQNNNPIYIKEGKSISVALASEQAGDNFNLYYLNPQTNEWDFKGKDEIGYSREVIRQKLDSLNLVEDQKIEEKEQILAELKELKNSKPIKPKAQNKDKFSFTINVDYKDFPELRAFNGLKFQVSDKDKKFDPKYADILWESVDVLRGEGKDEFVVYFANKSSKVNFITTPVVKSENMELAMSDYNRLISSYKIQKDSLKRRKREAAKRIGERSKKLNELKIIELNKMAQELAVIVENKIMRNFQVSQFGIWNSDCPEKMPTEAIVKADFRDENDEKLNFKNIFLVQKNKNVVLNIDRLDYEEGLRYTPNEETMIWAVTSDRKHVAIYSVEKFKRLKPDQKFYVFEMELISSKEFAAMSSEQIFNL
ncbi:hypothetical protein FRY74_06350 [Vicingus serpentipes]|uniref:Uncharacterized protein n=1 Tax=Vicingus serpentipes TaxID=1926625 RepID=A0A5C6RX62_9FLAO|nr:hypothetical protein [Vicingus serpentipes]TXB66190.1 hypothetical protein FRY74_06350 [Vicingus serpentipes]